MMQSKFRRTRAIVLSVAMLSSMAVGIAPAFADPDQGTAAPGEPCSAAEFPGSKLVTLSESRQSFVPSRGGLDFIEVCIEDLVGIIGNDFDLNIYEGGTATTPGPLVESVSHDTNGNILAATWVRIDLPSTLSVTPGTPYVIGLDPAIGLLSSVVFQWRATCNDGLLTSCEGVPDAYPDGSTNDLPGNADYGFRTDGPPANMVGDVAIDPELGCPGGVPAATGTVTNLGQTSVAASEAEWWLSTDPSLSPDDIFLGTRSVPSLAADGSHVVGAPDAFPDDKGNDALALGTYTLLLHVDSNDDVVESGEGDNVAGHTIEVTDCGQPDIENVVVSIEEATVSTAFRDIQAADLPIRQLAQGLPISYDEAVDNLEASPFGFSPLGFSPLGFSPLGFSPVGFSPLGFSPLGFSPLGFSPVGFSPLGFSPLGFSPLGFSPLGFSGFLSDIPQSELEKLLVVNVPIVDPGWEERLLAKEPTFLDTRPIQDVPFLEAIEVLDDLTLSDVDLRAVVSTNWLSAAMAHGTTNDVPAPSSHGSWCAWLLDVQDYDCSVTGFDPAVHSLVAADALGVDTSAMPIGAVTMDQVTINPNWLINDVSLTGTPRAHPELTRLGSEPVNVILTDPSSIVDCSAFDCDRSLGEAALEGHLLNNDVRALLNGLSPAGLAAMTVADLALLVVDINTVDLGDMFWPIVNGYNVNNACDQATYHVTADNVGDAAAVDSEIVVTLAQGFSYVPLSATLAVDGGAAQAQAEPVVSTAADGTRTLTFQTDSVAVSSLDLSFAACANLYIGYFEAGRAVVNVVGMEGPESANSDGSSVDLVKVVELTEESGPTDTPDTAQLVDANSVLFLNIQDASDTDHIKIAVPDEPNSLTIVRVFAPYDKDVDAFAHGPEISPLGFSPVGFSPLGFSPLGFSPLGFSPLGFSPFGFSPLGFSPLGFSDDSVSQPEPQNDVPTHLAPSNTTGLRAISAHRGATNETLFLPNYEGDEGFFHVGFNAYNAVDFSGPVVVTVQQVTPETHPELAVCTPAPWNLNAVPGSAPVWAGPGDPQTVFVTNRQVIESQYGTAAMLSGVAALEELAARPEINGIVLYADHDPDVRSAYAAWRNNWCSPSAANVAASTVRAEILELRAQYPTINTVILAGGDEILPDFRLIDQSPKANEWQYTESLLNAYGENNPVVAAFANGTIMSADPYGTESPIVFGPAFAYLPSAGVSRMLDPDDWVGQKDRYVASNGTLDPQAGMVSGYDGMVDGAEAAAQALNDQGIPTNALTSGGWTAQQWRNEAFPDDIVGANMHANHWAGLSQFGSDNNDESDIVTTAEIGGFQFGVTVFSNGCHFGTQAPNDIHAGNPTTAEARRLLDWTETITGTNVDVGGVNQSVQGIAVANSGFGIFDTEVVGYGEHLQQLFVAALENAPNAAMALATAKAQYFASLGVYDPYVYKTMQQLSMYGLGIFKMLGATGEQPPTPPADTDSLPVNIGPVSHDQVTTGNGTYFDVPDSPEFSDTTPLAVDGRPIVPKVTQEIVLPDGKASAGVWFYDLESIDVPDVDPAIARMGVSDPARETESQVQPAIFPTTPATVFDIGNVAHVTLPMGSFRSEQSSDGKTHGRFRLDTAVTAELLLRDVGDNTPAAHIAEVTASKSQDGSLVAVDAVIDETFGPIVRAAALGLDDQGEWTYRELAKGPNGHWTAAFLLSPGATEIRELRVKAFNGSRVSHWVNKGEAPVLKLDVVDGVDLQIVANGGQAPNGVYLGDVTVTIVGTPGVVYTASDGDHQIGEFGDGDSFVISGDGVHEIEVIGSDGSRVRKTIIIDGSAPVVTILNPVDGAAIPAGATEFVAWESSDTGTGETCTATVNGDPIGNGDALPTDSVGSYTVEVVCTDAAGNSTTATATYTVVSPYQQPITFDSPIKAKPRLNTVSPSSDIPVKFSVHDAVTGEKISDTGIIESRTWVPIDCSTKEVTGAAFEATGSDPEFADGFHYNTMSPSQTGCYELIVELDDGTQITAYFEVKQTGKK